MPIAPHAPEDGPERPDLATPPVLDVRAAEAFLAGHRPGAANIPLDELANRTHELPAPGGPLVVLCPVPDRPRAEALLGHRHAIRWADPRVPAPAAVETGPSRGRLWRPAALLERFIDRLPRGRALDLGCGSGRDAVFLAEHGFDVTAVDRLADALQRAGDLAARWGVSVRTVCADLRGRSALPVAGGFDVIACFYFLPAWLFAAMADALTPGGMLLIEAFTDEHAARFGRPRSPGSVVSQGRLSAAFGGLDIQLDRRLWLGARRHVCQFVARRG